MMAEPSNLIREGRRGWIVLNAIELFDAESAALAAAIFRLPFQP